MADPTQNDGDKKPVPLVPPVPSPQKEEVSAADLLSLWGGGAPSSASAKPAPKLEPKLELKTELKSEPRPVPKPESKPEAKLEPKPEPKLEEPEPKPKPRPRPKPKPKPKLELEIKSELKPELKPEQKLEPKSEPKPEIKPIPKPKSPPAPMPIPVPPPAPAPKPAPPVSEIKKLEPAPASKIIQPETAFWEIPKQEPKIEEPLPPPMPEFVPPQRSAPIHEPVPEPKPMPPPAPKPAPALEPRPIPSPEPKPIPPPAPKEHVIEEPFVAPKQKVKIEPDIFEEEEMPPPVKEFKKASEEIVEGEIVKSETLPPLSPPPEEHQENLNEENGFGSQVDDFLEELNLSRKHIFYGIGCLVLIIVLIFGGIWGYKFYKNRKQPEPAQQQQPQSKEPATAPVPVADTSTGVASTQELGKLLDMNLIGSTGINATSAVGVELTEAQGIGNYLMTFKRLQNAYETDINELLNQATDRRGRLNSHLALLGKFYVDGTLISSQIQQETDQIKIQYEEKKKVQQTHDSNFFDQIKAFNPQTTENILSDFINVSKEIVVLRARFKALQKVRSYYEFALPKLNARIKDIELNAEALILGLKVYDVKGSDLKLIIPIESSAGATQNDSLESASVPGLFINPASVNTGHDYIQSPGGGF